MVHKIRESWSTIFLVSQGIYFFIINILFFFTYLLVHTRWSAISQMVGAILDWNNTCMSHEELVLSRRGDDITIITYYYYYYQTSALLCGIDIFRPAWKRVIYFKNLDGKLLIVILNEVKCVKNVKHGQ